MIADPELPVPGGGNPGRAVRRPVRHRRAHHRHLLPARLPGPHPDAQERRLLPHRGRGPGRRLPRLPPMPAGRRAGIAGMEPARGHRRRRHAADRGRRGRPRGRAGPGPPARVHPAPPGPDDDGGDRRIAARAGPRPAGAHGARAADRDQPADRRHRLCRRLFQHPAVQRHGPRGVRHRPERTARPAPPVAGSARQAQPAVAGPGAVRRRPAAGFPCRARRSRRRGGTWAGRTPGPCGCRREPGPSG